MIEVIQKQIAQQASPLKASISQRFFKTQQGQYGEGDVFIGLTVPQIRTLAKQYAELSLDDIEILFCSTIHEERLLAILILIRQFEKMKQKTEQKKIYDFVLQHIYHVNNWDLVDTLAPKMIGTYLIDKDKSILYQFAQEENLWLRRIAIISCFHFIRHQQLEDALRISQILLHDTHDLIHKAVGWMLREIGKRDDIALQNFLHQYAIVMPRTMLRYAIEKMDKTQRQVYLKYTK